MKKKIISITMVGMLVLTIFLGCQSQSGDGTELPSTQETPTGPLTLQITSPRDGRETSWGFANVDGIVSPPEAMVTVNGVSVEVAADGSFESDYIPLNEGENKLRTVAILNGKKVSKTVTVNYTLKLHVSIGLNLEPNEDWFTESPAEIGGRVSDPRAEVTVNGRKAVVGNDGNFSVMMDFVEGTNSLTAIARLRDQTDTDTTEAFYVPPVPLSLRIKSPQDGHEARVDLIKITGTVSDPESTVLVNNIAALVSASGAFYAYIELDEGENRIDAIASRGGESATETINVTYRPPSVTPVEKLSLYIASPQDNAEYKVNLLSVTGTVSDAVATVVVNGVEATVAADGGFQGYVTLDKNENIVEVIAITDEVKIIKNIAVIFTPALVVYMEYPSPNRHTDYTKEPMTVNGRVNKPEAIVAVNGQAVPITPDGGFTTQVQLIEGSNSIKAVATLGDERDEVYVLFRVENGYPNPVPGYSHFFAASSVYEHEITLRAGETKRLTLALETRKGGPGRFSGRLVPVDREYGRMPQPMPEGLDAYLEPPEFMAYPNATYHFNLVFSTTPELAPGIYYLKFHQTFENGFYSGGWIEITVE